LAGPGSLESVLDFILERKKMPVLYCVLYNSCLLVFRNVKITSDGRFEGQVDYGLTWISWKEF